MKLRLKRLISEGDLNIPLFVCNEQIDEICCEHIENNQQSANKLEVTDTEGCWT